MILGFNTDPDLDPAFNLDVDPDPGIQKRIYTDLDLDLVFLPNKH
jgi:hypothetical protein